MLGLINRLAHGFVAVPVILACEERGVFSLLDTQGAMEASELIDATGANEGHLHVALRMLEALNWIKLEDGRLSVTGSAAERRFIPASITHLYHTPFTSVLSGAASDSSIRDWLRLSSERWNGASSFTADLIDGPLLLPLLLALCEKGAAENLLKAQASDLRRDIAALFLARGWADGTIESCHLSNAGRFLLDHISITSTVASYHPMLARMEDVLFGNCSAVFARDAEGFRTPC